MKGTLPVGGPGLYWNPARHASRGGSWRGGREAEGNGLLNRHTGLKPCIEGSNPSLSVRFCSAQMITGVGCRQLATGPLIFSGRELFSGTGVGTRILLIVRI